MSATDTPTTRRVVAVLQNGSRWEYRGRTPGGMVRLWAIGGGASLTETPDQVAFYGYAQTRHELLDADGSSINYSVTEHMLAEGYADRFPGSKVVTIDEVVQVNPSDRVLIDSGIDQEHWSLLRADARRFSNMSADAGRPSDAMRSAVRAFKAGHLTEESFAASRPSGYYPED